MLANRGALRPPAACASMIRPNPALRWFSRGQLAHLGHAQGSGPPGRSRRAASSRPTRGRWRGNRHVVLLPRCLDRRCFRPLRACRLGSETSIGTSNPEFVGRTAAAPLFFHIVDALRAREPVAARTCFTLTPELNLCQVDLCAGFGHDRRAELPAHGQGWFIPGKSPIAACDVHRKVWVDNATGLRLNGPSG